MAKSTFQDVVIRGIAAAVPKSRVQNLYDHEFIPEEERKKIIALTGVKEYRKTAVGVTAADLSEAAAKALFRELQIDPSTIDAIIFSTMTPDYKAPSTACVLQDRLGAPHSTVAYDINMGCSGYIVGLYNACSLISGAGLKRVLLLSGDTQTKLCHDGDKNVVFLLGDAGSATIIDAGGGGNGETTIELFTDGSRYKSLYVPAGGCRNPSTDATRKVTEGPDGGLRSDEDLFMNGMDIFKFSSTDVVKSLQGFLASASLTSEEFDYLVLHQANKFMNDKIARKLKFPAEKVPYCIDVYGNTAAASIPLTIVHNFERMKGSGELRCLLSGFGVGLSWGMVDVKLSQAQCPPVIEI